MCAAAQQLTSPTRCYGKNNHEQSTIVRQAASNEQHIQLLCTSTKALDWAIPQRNPAQFHKLHNNWPEAQEVREGRKEAAHSSARTKG